MKKLGSMVLIFVLGFMMRDLSTLIVPYAIVEVAGMNSYDLESDYDFKRAVESIVEDCTVSDESISC